MNRGWVNQRDARHKFIFSILPFPFMTQALKLDFHVNVCCWLQFDFNPLLIIQTIIKGIHRVNQYALQPPVPILHNMQGIDRVNQCTLQRPLSIFGSNSKIRSSRRFVSLAAV